MLLTPRNPKRYDLRVLNTGKIFDRDPLKRSKYQVLNLEVLLNCIYGSLRFASLCKMKRIRSSRRCYPQAHPVMQRCHSLHKSDLYTVRNSPNSRDGMGKTLSMPLSWIGKIFVSYSSYFRQLYRPNPVVKTFYIMTVVRVFVTNMYLMIHQKWTVVLAVQSTLCEGFVDDFF